MIELLNIGIKRDEWVLRNVNLTIEQGKIYRWDEGTVDWVLVKNPQFVPGT